MKTCWPLKSSLLLTLCIAWQGVGSAYAQESGAPMAITPPGASEEEPRQPGRGILLNSFRILPSVDFSTYFDSNVFRTSLVDDPNTVTQLTGSSISSLIARVKGSRGGSSGQDEVSFDASLGYSQYLSSDATVRALSDFDLGIGGRLHKNPKGQKSFLLENSFQRQTSPRTIRAVEAGLLSPTFAQDVNRLMVGARLRPAGGALEQQFAYTNTLSIFEGQDLTAANRMRHDVSAYTKWSFLPRTAALFSLQAGYNNFFEDINTSQFNAVDSRPLRVTIGALGLIGSRIQFKFDIGYGNSFHVETFNPLRNSFFSGIIGGMSARVNIADRDILSLGYAHDFSDSLFGNFIIKDKVDFSWTHAFTDRLQGSANINFSLDRFSDIPPINGQSPLVANRVDLPLQIITRADYFVQKNLKVGLNLALISLISNFRVIDNNTGGINDANYFSFQGGVQASYTY